MGYGEDRVYTWWDGDRAMRVRLEPDEDPQRYGGSEGDPVFRSESGGGLMTLPGGVLLALDPSWSSSKVDAFFSKNKIKRNRVSPLGFLDNAFFVETEPGFLSLRLANDLADKEGVGISTPNWAIEIETHQTPREDDHGDNIRTATVLPLNTRMSGVINSDGDVDVFQFQVSASTLVAVGNFEEGGFNWLDGNTFSIIDASRVEMDSGSYALVRLEAGTYYVKVDNEIDMADERRWEYDIEVRTIADQGDTIETAGSISVQSAPDPDPAAFADLDAEDDLDIFKIVVDTPTEVVVHVFLRPGVAVFDLESGDFFVPFNVDLLDASGDPVHPAIQGISPDGRPYRLAAGTHYLRVSAHTYRQYSLRPYVLRLFEDTEYTEFIDGCAQITPDSIDPLHGCQWHLHNDEDNEGTPGNDINLGDVWQTTKGEGVNVAIIDQTVESSHEDLSENWNASLSHSYLPVLEQANPRKDHGTAVAGIVAARDNGKGIVGVAPRASIVGYNLLDDYASLATILDALTRDMEDVAVANNSWGYVYGSYHIASQLWTEALKAGATRGLDGKGVLYVFAAGNSHESGKHTNLAESKNSYFQTLACGVDADGIRKDYSETGYALWVCAPSANVTTSNWNRYRENFGGTSAAAPVVSGVAALVRSAKASLTWRDVKLILAESARKTDPENAGWEEAAIEYGSQTERYFYNPEYGFGVVDATAAVELAESWTNLPPMKSVSAHSGGIDLAIPDFTDEDGPTTVSRELYLSSEVGFTEFVEISVEFDHPSFRHLEIEIQSPAGTVSTLTAPSGSGYGSELDTRFRFGSAAHLGEDPSGVWTLRLADHFAGQEGKVLGWSIKVYGHGEGVAVPRALILPGDQDWEEAPELAAPEAPGQVVVDPGDGRLTVRWLAPEEESGSAITAYKVRWSAWDTPANMFEVTVTDLESLLTDGDEYAVQIPWLTNGVEYTVRVIAVSGNGENELGEVKAIPAMPGVAAIRVDICDRTEQVRDAILLKLTGTDDCSLVTSAQLQTVRGALDLGDMDIETLQADDFRHLTSLQRLDLSGKTQLSALPEGVFDNLFNLEVLGLEGSDLSALPSGVFDNLTNMEWLYLQHNDLSALPDGVFDNLTNLRYLDLRGNELSGLPSGVFHNLPKLEALHLESNRLAALPDGVFDNLPKLQSLDLLENDLSTLTDGVFDNLPNLEDLYLGGNDLSALPDGVFDNLTNLWELDLSGNDLGALPDGVFDNLTNLWELDLSGNDLGALPDGVFDNLTSLWELDLSGNDLGALPDGVFDNLPSLWELDLSGNDLGALPDGVFDNLPSLEGLYLSGNDLSTLPDSVFDNLADLYVLYLGSNDLSAPPDGVFDNLANLEYLDLGGNDLSTLPDSVFDNLTNLGWLTLRSNDLSELPDGVFDNLANLEYLYLDHNDLSELPGGVFDNLANLYVLYLANNDLSELPDGVFGNLANLEYLYLDHNDLSELPGGVFDNLANLYVLYLANNDLSELPNDLFEGLSNLHRLELQDNPGAPFTFTAELAQDGEDAVAVEIGWALPFSMLVTLSAQGGTLSTDTVTVFAGTSRSEGIQGTPDADEPVTVTVVSAVFILLSIDGKGFQAGIGQPLTLGDIAASSPATGQPTISGTAQVGETLTAVTSGIEDVDGLDNVAYSYLWLADDADIVGATGDTYTLEDADAGLTIKVKVSFFDDNNNPETLTSEGTAAVLANVPGAPEHLNVSPHDTGALDLYWEAPVDDGGSDITGYKVQWKRVGDSWDTPADVFEETATGTTHTITGLTDGVEYAVRVIAVNDIGDGPPSDEATGTPRETTPPELSTATVDGATMTLTYDEDLDENSEPSPDAFSVTAGGTGRAVDGVSVSGSSVILTLGSAVAAEDTVTVSYTVPTDAAAPRIQDEAGNPAASFSDELVTNNTPKPNSPATGQPTIGGTAQVGETLTAETRDIEDDDGLANVSFSYQWLANGADIAGATDPTYTLVDDDASLTIKVQVSFFDDKSNQETLTSAATAAVDPDPGPITGFTVVDASDQSVEGALADGGALALDDPDGGSFGIRADLEPGATIGSMSLELTGAETHAQTENITPYSLYGDSGGNLSGESLPVGEYTLTATAYSEARLGGNVLGTLKVSFSVTETATQQPNSPATGLPTISGTARVGETLRADIFGIADADGMSGAVFSYQWLANEVNIDTDIAGATDPTYTLVADDVGKAIRVRVSFDDDRNFLETLTSEATATVVTPLTAEFQDAPDKHLGTGVFTFVIAFSEPISISYKTLRDDSLEVTNGSATKAKRVDGQSDLWKITVEPDSDAAVTVVLPITEDCGAPRAVCSRAGGNERRPLSNRSELTVPGPAAANSPATGAPSISGTAQVGETLTVDTSGIDDEDGLANASFSYQWLANDAEIVGATDPTYTLVDADFDKAVKVRVIFNDDDNNEETLTSEATAAVAAKPNSPATGAPTISGTVRVGEILTAHTSDIGDADGMSNAEFGFNWWAAEGYVRVTGVNKTYRVQSRDVGLTISVSAGFMDDAGNLEILSSAETGAVEPTTPAPPQNLNVSLHGTGELDLSWEAPISDLAGEIGGEGTHGDGGSDITGYKVQWKSGSEDYDGSAGSTRQAEITDPASRTHTITGLTDGVEYAVRVIAVNDVGDGPPSDEATATPRETTPPELATATVDGTTLTLTYDEDLDENSEPSSDAFSVTAGGTGRAVDGVSVSGSSVILTLASAVTAADTVTVSYTALADTAAPRIRDLAGNAAASFSDELVTNNTPPPANTPATGAPSISGTVRVGETLTAETSAIADADGLDNVGYSYQWLANGADIGGATSSSYTLVEADAGLTIKVKVSFRDDKNNPETLTSAATAAVEPRPNTPATGAPTISGTAQVGETLTVETSAIDDADGLDKVGYSYQWLANGADITGATSSSYTLVDADKGKTIQVKVSFRDDKNNPETLTSAATAAVEPRPNSPATGAPTISGTVRVGETLTAEISAIADADGMSGAVFSYLWLADDVDIAGATSDTYTLVDADQGKAVKVRVIFTDNADNEETLTSEPTEEVAARPNSPATGAPSISGTARVGETLTAETSGIDDADGLDNVSYSYQWLANDADIAGATSDTYTPVADDVGKAIKVRVIFRDDRNHQESLTSEATAAVTAAADESAVWSATLTVGSIGGFRGFWKDAGMGELTPEVFTLDGVDHTVKVLADSDGPQFYLTVDKALPVGFTLQVGAATLSSQGASIREFSSGATQYGWATNQEAILADVDTVEVSLTLAE